MSLINRTPVSELVAEHITEEIVRGKLQSGDPIREVKWAEHLKVSRSSVREALLMLERRHMVSIEPGKGAKVSKASAQSASELMEVWTTLGALVIKRLAVTVTPEISSELNTRLEQMSRLHARQDKEAYYSGCIGLMTLIASLAEHRLIQSLLKNLLPALRRNFYFAITNNPEEMDSAQSFIRQLIHAISSRQPEQGANALRDYAADQLNRMKKSLSDA